jgi:PilZ domain
MEKGLECSFYCNSKDIGRGREIGFCNLDGDRTICSGDLNVCEKPSISVKSQNEQTGNENNRRKHPRFYLDLPLEYRGTNTPKVHGAIVVNASESGLLVQSIKELPIGAKLNIAVLFPKEYELANIEILAEIVWKDIHWEENWEGFQFGLKFLQISEEDYRKLKQLLNEEHGI